MSSDEVDKDVEDTGESEVKQNGVKEEEAVSKPVVKKKAGDAPKIKQPAKKRVKTEQVENKKQEKKQVKKDEKNEDESEEEVEKGGEKAVPLLDQPLEISGSRKRKEVARFIPVSRDEESKEVRIPEGKGKALGEIAWVEAQIQRAKPDDLKLLHRMCFGKPGKAAMVKKTLRKFNGFEFEEASDEYEKKKVAVENSFKKVTVAHLKNICNLLNLEKGGQKSELIDRILSYLTKPVDSGKKFPGSGRSKRSGASAKNYDEGEEKFQSRKKGKAKKKEVASDHESETEEKSADEKNYSEEDTKEDEDKNKDSQTAEESEEESPVKKAKTKKGGKKGKKTETAEKKAPPKKRVAAKKTESDKEEASAESEEDDEPLAKKSKAPPTDDEIKTYVKSLLDGANLEQITMKKVCQQVYEHYPDFDLGQKKDFIKTTVKSLISS